MKGLEELLKSPLEMWVGAECCVSRQRIPHDLATTYPYGGPEARMRRASSILFNVGQFSLRKRYILEHLANGALLQGLLNPRAQDTAGQIIGP